MRHLKGFFAVTALLTLALPLGLGAEQAASKSAPRVINMTGTDNMRFQPSAITAKPGERLRIVLKTTSTMPKAAMAHNFVMLKPGADIVNFVNASAMARPTFIAPKLKDQVLVASDLAGGGETVTVEFSAPKAPGKYTFFCSFPGHYAGGMVGTLTVR